MRYVASEIERVLVEAKLNDSEPDPSLRYYAERLRPAHVIQVVRGLAGARFASQGVRVVPATTLLGAI